MKERRLRVFENRVLREIFGPKKNEVTGRGGVGGGEDRMMRSSMISTSLKIFFR